MKGSLIILFLMVKFFVLQSSGQNSFIYSKEGRAIVLKEKLITNCLQSFNKTRNDDAALSICQCQVEKIDRKLSNRLYALHTHRGIINFSNLVKADPEVYKNFTDCYYNSGQTYLLEAESSETSFISACVKKLKAATEKEPDSLQLINFCRCQLQLVKSKRIGDEEMRTLSNPNSLLFFEMTAKCGDPFADKSKLQANWSSRSAADVDGPVQDTVAILNLNGLTYAKIKMGSLVYVWLFDTGASDVMIDNEMEKVLQRENILKAENFMGTGEYEMANGQVDTCRKYMVNNVQIGKYHINNVVVAVTDKGKRIIAGRSLLNKFSQWLLDNRSGNLVLTK